MFQYVRHPGIVGWVCLKPDGEDIILVIPRNVKILSTSLFMLEMESRKLKLGDMLSPLKGKAM